MGELRCLQRGSYNTLALPKAGAVGLCGRQDGSFATVRVEYLSQTPVFHRGTNATYFSDSLALRKLDPITETVTTLFGGLLSELWSVTVQYASADALVVCYTSSLMPYIIQARHLPFCVFDQKDVREVTERIRATTLGMDHGHVGNQVGSSLPWGDVVVRRSGAMEIIRQVRPSGNCTADELQEPLPAVLVSSASNAVFEAGTLSSEMTMIISDDNVSSHALDQLHVDRKGTLYAISGGRVAFGPKPDGESGSWNIIAAVNATMPTVNATILTIVPLADTVVPMFLFTVTRVRAVQILQGVTGDVVVVWGDRLFPPIATTWRHMDSTNLANLFSTTSSAVSLLLTLGAIVSNTAPLTLPVSLPGNRLMRSSCGLASQAKKVPSMAW